MATAIRIYCLLLRVADYKLEALVKQHVGLEEAVKGNLDGNLVDLGFLTLHEHARVERTLQLRDEVRLQKADDRDEQVPQTLTPYVVAYGKALLPRPGGPTNAPSSTVPTATTIGNLEQLARLLQAEDPILLHGLPGSGKTSLIHEVAKELGMYSGVVTLHLNEQTDAKMLVGLYSTDSKPGSFSWRPGVLTTAVKEGRWVLVEDLDRAPTEVLSTLLPLIERRELLIPSRGERIRAASSFRLFATLRTSRGMNGRENLPTIVGMRFWQAMHTSALTEPEMEEVVLKTYPVLHKFVPGILAVYSRLGRLSRSSGSGRALTDRPMNLRDLLKWCRRLHECLTGAGTKSGDEPITETTRDWMFMEALDCFAGSCADPAMNAKISRAIAEEMHIGKERAEHYLTGYIPALEENESSFNIGRTRLRKKKLASRVRKQKRPFASTAHAKKLLEQIATAVNLSEPVLLVGETGIGKTTVVQQLADSLGHKLNAVNLSQQSEVGDLLGGFKPVNVRTLAVPLKEDFEDLFAATGISASKNERYLDRIGKYFARGEWAKVSKLWKEAPVMFSQILKQLEKSQAQQDETRDTDEQQPAKRRKTQSKLQSLLDLRPRWQSFSQKLEQFDVQISGGADSFAFSFMEGNLVKAVRNGDWVLLDEINLASPDTLESIADLLTGPAERPTLLLSETGEIDKIVAHPNFRIFGAMNPATDIGKRDLPTGIRSRFTELYVRSPDTDLKDLLTIIKTYLGSSSSKHDDAAVSIANLYLDTKKMAEDRRLVDGANEVPHFSLRTLTRVLSYVSNIAPLYGLRRALYEGFSMGFLTLLDRNSEDLLQPLIRRHLFSDHNNFQSLLSQPPKHPDDGKQYVKFKNKKGDRHYWLFQGAEPVHERSDYIITPYVERNLLNLVRATSTRRFPILIQGPTSAGKTSMIEYLANYTGNKFVRINNHEHTDLQEYLGTYVSAADGKLRFQEGLLVQAMRQGHWIVLDELNLAPTDVLEALNRLLDDNRELLIPETQEVVRPHENFILFATQNPPGLYGGRKVLSRAFRNRFLELHFDDIPEDELETILRERSRNTSPPDCKRIVEVYQRLSKLRQTNRLFEQKDSFATLRDLFRWALREGDNRQQIAEHGFMLLAERVRDEEERLAVKKVIEEVFKAKINLEQIYSAESAPELRGHSGKDNSQGVVWTHAMRRLYVLVARALKNTEPVLLVGETGCGKTTVCQLLAEALHKELHIVNAHQNTETGDLIGSQRPIRNRASIVEVLDADVKRALQLLGCELGDSPEDRLQQYKSFSGETLSFVPQDLQQQITINETRSKALFEWSDGALVESMRQGQFFLLDEISLADDSVLERLNSVLEPQRTLLLAEKGIDNSFVKAAEGFQMFATMNPGGDFGKKELSPALRNRFTEIWVPPLSDNGDINDIVSTKLQDGSKDLVEVIVAFATWFGENFRSMSSTRFSIREILVWVQFVNNFASRNKLAALVHGAATIFVDSIGANPSAILTGDGETVPQQRARCLRKLSELTGQDVSAIYQLEPTLIMDDRSLTIGDFAVSRTSTASADPGFAFHAPTTRLNGMRVLRAMQMQKPILLEGSPGVGKTTLVAALARACGEPLTRINLSDQTDLMDLFGTDVPVEGAEAGNFAWRDAPFLQAMQKGEWVLLDEMNLASQSVLEGLNACLDHRGEVYISELDQVFKRHPNFRLFAAQNPHNQGGGRKGLPSSFVNRFVVVYADVFSDEDLLLIASHNFPNVAPEVITHLIRFISRMEHATTIDKSFGAQGGPWEFNLRDVLRWLHLLNSSDDILQGARIDDFLNLIVRQRFRSERDRDEVNKLFSQVTGVKPRGHSLYHDVSSLHGQVGMALLQRNLHRQPERLPGIDTRPRLPELETLMICVKKNIPCILSSPSGYGKTVLLEHVAALAGRSLVVFPMNADIDTMDLVGGFEQADPFREVNAMFVTLKEMLQEAAASCIPDAFPDAALDLLHQLDNYDGDVNKVHSIQSAIEHLAATTPAKSQINHVLGVAIELLKGPLKLANPRFEWLDGVIVKALQQGQWLVLDNANMCNASVLDRLNSLLEPNGFLSINEHCEPGGEPRVVKPHPDFRIFLTVDPRYGELSRAMRNRAVEIYIHTPPPAVDSCFDRVAQVEGGLHRLHQVEKTTAVIKPVARDLLSIGDLAMLQRFADDQNAEKNGIDHPEKDARGSGTSTQENVAEILEYLATETGNHDLQAVSRLYEGLSPETVSVLRFHQPIHPQLNMPVTQRVPDVQVAAWLGVRYEFNQWVHRMFKALDNYKRSVQGAKVASLNRLERSLLKDRVAIVSKDSTANLAEFLRSLLSVLVTHLGKATTVSSWKEVAALLHLFERYIHRTMALATATFFDEAKFQAHLAHGADLFQSRLNQDRDGVVLASSEDIQRRLLEDVSEKLNRAFTTGFKLSTGLSMEVLWQWLRPTPFRNDDSLRNAVELFKLAARFDDIRWKTSASVADLANASADLARAYTVVKNSGASTDELVKALTDVVEKEETRIGVDALELQPYFMNEFEAIRQILLLETIKENRPGATQDRELLILSNASSQSSMALADAGPTSSLLQTLDSLATQQKHVWDGKFTTSLWARLKDLDNVNLRSLAMLEVEMPVLGHHLTTADIVSDPVATLNDTLVGLLLQVFEAHASNLKVATQQIHDHLTTALAPGRASPSELLSDPVLGEFLGSVEPPHLRTISATYLVPAMVATVVSNESETRRAYFSALAWVYFSVGLISLYVPDRAFDPQIRPQMEREFYEDMQESLQLNIEMLRSFELEFTGQDSSVRIERLHEELEQMGPLPPAVQPVYRPANPSELSRMHAEFSNILKAATSLDLPTGTDSLSLPEDYSLAPDRLHLVRENVQRLGIDSLESDQRQTIFECFHSFYDEWSTKLEADKKAEAANTSLYRFQGGLEDEEEVNEAEFHDLFPGYEEEGAQATITKNSDQVRDTSIKVAKAHSKIFTAPAQPQEAMSTLTESVAQRVSDEMTEHAYVDRTINSKMLAANLLLLDEKKTRVAAPHADSSYNFYTSENLGEARRLVSLAHKIKARFRDLQFVDEIGHMQPLADVTMACDKLLDVTHTEALAAILPKVEYLHAFVYEWQFGGWASRTHAVPELHDALTKVIIDWRKLELSTWAKLFDTEQQKCQDDAYAWWFVAYQVVIAVPLSLVESPTELREYAMELVKNLELYFSTSIVGQFGARLALLRQLCSHLCQLVKDYPSLDVIHTSVTNFIDFFARYETTAIEAIKQGRAPIEKKMKDVVLLASWKDTNINALRESARKSHQKLFRLVRKFRGVLGQEMRAITTRGLPEQDVSNAQVPTPTPSAGLPHDSVTAQLSKICADWMSQNRRVANAAKTVSIMSRLTSMAEMSTSMPSILDSFVSSLNDSMAELRKETPQNLNDENKNQVKYLKTRKRKLFADTLKELRQMGIRHNLPQDRLAEQDSLAVALAGTAPISQHHAGVADAAQYYFHKVLDQAPTVRSMLQTHSEELTPAEIARGVGFVEGFIHLLLNQRRNLTNSVAALCELQAASRQLKALGDVKAHQSLNRVGAGSNWVQLLSWLVQIIDFAARLIQTHAKLSETEYADIIAQFQLWSNKFGERLRTYESLGPLPKLVTSTALADLETGVEADLQLLGDFLKQVTDKHPRLSSIVDQVRQWAQLETSPSTSSGASLRYVDFANGASQLCDKVLVAVEAGVKASKDTVQEEDSAGWLVNHDKAFALMIKQLRMKQVTTNILECVRSVQDVDLEAPEASTVVMGVASLAAPIVDQFTLACEQSVGRLLDIHRATAHMAYNLTKTFSQIAAQGFCTPREKSEETSEQSGKLESGTGLGEGQGAEDISKDIQDDEDLTELAQEPNKEDNGDIEDEKDAVDMADEELEGQMNDAETKDDEEGSNKGDEEEEENDMDEEAGEVDDLDQNAVDEKTWDGDDEDKADKDQQGEKAKGQKQQDDQQLANEDQAKKKEEDQQEAEQDEPADEPNAEDAEAEQEDVKAQDDLNKQDQTAEDADALNMPDDMDLDFDDKEELSSDSDDLDNLPDAEEEVDKPEEEGKMEEDEGEEVGDNTAAPQDAAEDQDGAENEEPEEEEEAPMGEDEVDEDMKPEEQENEPEEASKDDAPPPQDTAMADKDNVAPSEVKSSGQDQSGDAMDMDDEFQDNAAKQDDGELGQGAADQEATAGEKGEMSRANDPKENERQDQKDSDKDDAAPSNPFKKMGDDLEEFHRQQDDIKAAKSEEEAEAKQQPDADQSRREFQHLQHDDAGADAQAMGAANEDEVQPIDESMAIDEEKRDPESRVMEEDKDEAAPEVADEPQQQESMQAQDKEKDVKDQDDGRSGVKTHQGNYDREHTPDSDDEEDVRMGEGAKDEEVEETSTQLSATHISSDRELRDFGECMQQWVEFQSRTHAMSLSLTSQLRLILTPSQSTKLSGSFRTGKRLNIKRIIPYIASSYKRDKIWMRRSVPTKRTYQIMLCVDDSKSMGEAGSGTLAMESLVMVSRSLTMLEVGQVGVMGFGADVFTAHELTEPFAADAGARVLQNFSFSQNRTDIVLLIRQTIDKFRIARQQQSNGDLWQLALIISDGLVESSTHDVIRRLLREAMEERIMMVFIVMDDQVQKGSSVLDLGSAKFKDGEVVVTKYLDTFPFPYFLIVHNLEELPSALAGLLRMWFAEVAS
ncbi:Midasin [Emericellopsis cladophorae]|uniref:Midasin n=1 Tax=Emericellopsis cladophorae TaxID=2686198 RepID=A0A9P9Y176_9HYPO|nr:Midasin [Emericellopsis cladophorae]KAI6781079.1 Midasin [Emericellopsis cladophorae]